jgi:hypothetical protein
MGIKIGPIDIGDTKGSPLNFEENVFSGVYQPLADAATDVYEGVSGVVHEVGEVTGLDKIGDAIGDSPVAKAVVTAIAAYYGMPYLAKYFGMAGGASGAATAAAEAAAWEASSLASMGASTAEITTNLVATGMSQTAAAQAATMAATGASQSMIASTLAGGANQAAQIAYAADAAGMGLTEAQIGADLVSMGMSNANAGFLAADAAGLAASGASSSAIAQNMLNSSGLGSLSAPTAGGSSLWQKATDLINPSTQTGSSLWNTVGNLGGAALAGSYTDEQINRTRQIAADAAKAAEFKPYTISTPTSSVNMTKDALNVNLSPNQQTMFNNLEAQALQASQTNPYVDPQGLFNTMLSTVTPQNERDRLALEQRMAAQGRLGVATAAYGGTPEQLALAKAQQEALNTMALNSQLKAGELTGQNITNRGGMMSQMYAPVQNARQDTQQALAAQEAAQRAAVSQGLLTMQGENAVAAALAKQQNDYLNAYSGMLGGTNAARTVNDVIGAGKSIWDLGKSFF